MISIEDELDSLLFTLGLFDTIKQMAERLTPVSFLKKAAKVLDKNVEYLRNLGEQSSIVDLPEDEQITTHVDRILRAAHGKETLKIRKLYENLEKLHWKYPEVLKKLSKDLETDASLPEAAQTIQNAINRTFVVRYFRIAIDMEDRDSKVLLALGSMGINVTKDAMIDFDGELIHLLQNKGVEMYNCANAQVSDSF